MILSLCCVHLQEDNDFKELTLFTSHIVEILKSKPLATNVVEIEQDLYQKFQLRSNTPLVQGKIKQCQTKELHKLLVVYIKIL